MVLGLVALWLGQTISQQLKSLDSPAEPSAEITFTLSNRAIAIWALACLAAIVPAGITGLQILVR